MEPGGGGLGGQDDPAPVPHLSCVTLVIPRLAVEADYPRVAVEADYPRLAVEADYPRVAVEADYPRVAVEACINTLCKSHRLGWTVQIVTMPGRYFPR